VIGNHFGDHLPDRQSLTVSALDIAGLEPIEATVRVICTLLLGKEKRKAVSVRQRRSACALIVSRRGLCASVQHHDKWDLPRFLWRQVREHAQRARIGANVLGFSMVALCKTPLPHSRSRQGHGASKSLPHLLLAETILQQFQGTTPSVYGHVQPVRSMLRCTIRWYHPCRDQVPDAVWATNNAPHQVV
jgi:hypothetical protein